MSAPVAPTRPATASARQQYMEEKPVPQEIIDRINAEMGSRGEKPIDYVRRIAGEIRLRVGGMSRDTLAALYPDFAIRYHKLFGMLCDPRFSQARWDQMLIQWNQLGGGEIGRETSKTDTRYQNASKEVATSAAETYFPPALMQRVRDAQNDAQ